jgi:hypothetical protein
VDTSRGHVAGAKTPHEARSSICYDPTVMGGQSGWSALALLCSACLRFGYEPRADAEPDAGPGDAGTSDVPDAAFQVDAGAAGAAGAGQGAGGAGQGAGGAGQGAGGSGGVAGAALAADAGGADDEDAGVPPNDRELGDTGLVVGDILGFYSGDWGDMVLERRDAEIWGVYIYNDGTIVGAITGEGVFAGWWSQLPTRAAGINAGEVEFRWSRTNAGVIALDGRWRYGTSGAWLENWDVNLVTDRSPPSALIAGFNDIADFRRHP